MFKRVLVPLDGSALSEQVLPHAVSLAKVLGSAVTLLRTAHFPYYTPMDLPSSV